MDSHKIINCYDSHVHWQATGEMATRLQLGQLRRPEDILRLNVEPHHWQGEWLRGFGWDDNLWPETSPPHRSLLDQRWPDQPVCLSRADGHAFWVNSQVLKMIGWLDPNGKLKPVRLSAGGEVVLDSAGQPTGVLVDRAKAAVEAILPKSTESQICGFLMRGMKIFNQAGFTHIRDLSGDPDHWLEARRLEESGLLSLAVEQFFFVDDPQDYQRALKWALRARTEESENLRVGGVKVYLDGALGSEGALLSAPYRCHHSHPSTGLSLMGDELLVDILETCWAEGMPVAIHVIGDQACHRVAKAARQIWDRGVQGELHMEHSQLMRPETVELLKGQSLRCHMQPCHWLSDRLWLREKLGEELFTYAFPWRLLQESGISFDFGSDSPIARPSVADNFKAIELSAEEGIPRLLGALESYHSHPDQAWTPATFTQFDRDWKVERVVFRGQDISLT